MKDVPDLKARRISKPSRKSLQAKRAMHGTGRSSVSGSRSAIDTISAAELQTKEFPPLRFAVNGYIAEGVTLLVGKPKVGKSWMALDFAVAVATGGRALGAVECARGAVLYLALEDNLRRIQRRMRQLFRDSDHWPSGLHFAVASRSLEEGLVDDLRDWIEDHDPELVIIDTLARVKQSRKQESGYGADYSALSPLQEMAGELRVAILVVHHLRKLESEDPFDMISGTTGLVGAVDAALILHRGSNGVALYGRGREIEEIEHAVGFEGGFWKLLGDVSEVRRSDERSAILRVAARANAPIGPKEIAKALDEPVNNIKQLLRKMVKDNQIVKLGRGKYVPAAKP